MKKIDKYFFFFFSGADILELKILSMTGASGQETSSHELDQNKTITTPKSFSNISMIFNQNNQNRSSPQMKNGNETSKSAPSSTMDLQASMSFTPVQARSDAKKQSGNFTPRSAILKKKSRTSVGEILAHGSHSNENR